MYDRSLDIFAPHRPPEILTVYPAHLGVGPFQASLGVGGEVWSRSSGFGSLPGYPHLSGDRLIFFDGYGIGGPGRRGYQLSLQISGGRRGFGHGGRGGSTDGG